MREKVIKKERESNTAEQGEHRLLIHHPKLFSFHYRVNRLLLQKTHSRVAMWLR